MVTEKDILVSGFVEIGSSVFVNDREVDVTFGHFETTVSALEGDFTLHIVAMDEGATRPSSTASCASTRCRPRSR
jgi:hypothetical protein